MTYTESAQAKIRSRSAPRQSLNSERPDAVKRYVHGYWDEETISENGWPLQANFSNTAYQSDGPNSSSSTNSSLLEISITDSIKGYQQELFKTRICVDRLICLMFFVSCCTFKSVFLIGKNVIKCRCWKNVNVVLIFDSIKTFISFDTFFAKDRLPLQEHIASLR